MTVPFMRAYTQLLVQDVPSPRRARDRRHGRVHPVAARSRGERGRAREGGRGQAARGGRRLRRHVGRASGSRAGRAGRVRRRARRAAEPARPQPRRRRGRRRSSCSTSRSRAARSPTRGCALNVSVGVRYVDAWLQGVGAAAIDNLMEDAATAEISRAQIWSWVHAGRFDEARVRARDRRGRGLRRGEGGLRRRRALDAVQGVPDHLCLRAAAVSLESTKADDIAVLIEEAIVSGELEPGSVLRQEQLSERFGVSRTPVREALRRLAALGLVSFEPNRGVRVRTMSHGDLREAFMVRAELEGLVTELAARRLTPEGLHGARGVRAPLRAADEGAALARPGRRPARADDRLDAREPRLPRRALPDRRRAVHRVGREGRAAHVLRPGALGARRRGARPALRAQPGRAPRDPPGARRRLDRAAPASSRTST